jgi:hypothetical protein
VLLLNPVPPVPVARGDTNACAVVRILMSACTGRVDRMQAARELQVGRRVHRLAVAGIAGAAVADFEDDLCGPRICSSERNGRNLYRDRAHLSVAGALTLTDRFRTLVRTHART